MPFALSFPKAYFGIIFSKYKIKISTRKLNGNHESGRFKIEKKKTSERNRTLILKSIIKNVMSSSKFCNGDL